MTEIKYYDTQKVRCYRLKNRRIFLWTLPNDEIAIIFKRLIEKGEQVGSGECGHIKNIKNRVLITELKLTKEAAFALIHGFTDLLDKM